MYDSYFKKILGEEEETGEDDGDEGEQREGELLGATRDAHRTQRCPASCPRLVVARGAVGVHHQEAVLVSLLCIASLRADVKCVMRVVI